MRTDKSVPGPETNERRDQRGDSADNASDLPPFMGIGDGTFGPFSDAYTTSGYAFIQGLTAIDFNGDGRLDLLVPVRDRKEVAILTGNGNLTFQATTITVPGLLSSAVRTLMPYSCFAAIASARSLRIGR